MYKFKAMDNLIKMNPSLQFSRKAMREDPVSLSDAFSPTGMSLGMGQELGGNTDSQHNRNVKKHRLSLNMMKFNMQRGS